MKFSKTHQYLENKYLLFTLSCFPPFVDPSIYMSIWNFHPNKNPHITHTGFFIIILPGLPPKKYAFDTTCIRKIMVCTQPLLNKCIEQIKVYFYDQKNHHPLKKLY